MNDNIARLARYLQCAIEAAEAGQSLAYRASRKLPDEAATNYVRLAEALEAARADIAREAVERVVERLS